MYGIMKKTTIYLPDELKKRVEQAAAEKGWSEADVIREAIDVSVRPRSEPRIPLPGMTLGDPTIAARAGDLLDGFGE
jgi:hypothetical protein